MATKWGIISAGKISHDFVTAVRSLPEGDHEIVAIAAQKLSDAEKFATIHKIPKAYGSYEELAKDVNVEVVFIGNIHPLHYPVSIMMLNHGKHLLVEKPLTLNEKMSRQLLQMAKDKKLFCMEAVCSRFLPSYEFVMKQLHDGVIGQVYHVNVTFGVPISNIERVVTKSLGGGALLDIGIYALNIIEMTFGGEMPQKVTAVGHLNADGCDESVSASMLFSNGKTASFAININYNYPCEAQIVGTKGIIKLPYPFACSDKVYVNDTCHEFPYPDTILPCNFWHGSGLRYEAIEVRRCLKSGVLECDRMTHNDSLLLAHVEDQIRAQIGVKYDVD